MIEVKLDFFNDFKAFQKDMPELKLNATARIKTAKGEYSFKYADLTSILKTAKPLLHKHNFIYSWSCNLDGSVTCKILHISGHLMESTCNIKAGDDPKNQGAAITYGKRYSLVALLGLTDQDKDAPPGETIKKKMSDTAFQKAQERIRNGDHDIVKECLMHLNVSEEQKDILVQLEFEYNG